MAALEAPLHLVDDVNPALTADQTVGAVATTQRFQRVTDLHLKNPWLLWKAVVTGRIWQKKGVPANRSRRARTLRFLGDHTAKCQSEPAVWNGYARRSSPGGRHALETPLADRLCFFVRHRTGIALLGKRCSIAVIMASQCSGPIDRPRARNSSSRMRALMVAALRARRLAELPWSSRQAFDPRIATDRYGVSFRNALIQRLFVLQ